MNELIFLMIRNTLASWLINIEFVGPIIIWMVAYQKRKRCPSLYRKLSLPIFIWVLAGLVKQINLQFLSPLVLVQGNITLSSVSYWIYIFLYTILMLVSGIGVVRLMYYKRRKSNL